MIESIVGQSQQIYANISHALNTHLVLPHNSITQILYNTLQYSSILQSLQYKNSFKRLFKSFDLKLFKSTIKYNLVKII